VIYRGISNDELKYYKDKGRLGYFFSESLAFANDYGDIIIEAKLTTNNVFNSHDPREIKKLYDNGFILSDKYEDVDYITYEDYIENGSESDTWDVIENSGVLDWILSEYDVCYISEGGIGNFYIEDSKFIEVVNIK